jgi:hypothetical protein
MHERDSRIATQPRAHVPSDAPKRKALYVGRTGDGPTSRKPSRSLEDRGVDVSNGHNHEDDLAVLLTATPGARAKLFANPTKFVGKNMPPERYWEYLQGRRSGDGSDGWHPIKDWRAIRRARRHLAEDILVRIARDVRENKLASQVNTDAVFEEYFAPIVKVSRRSVTSVFYLSYLAFLAGLGLIAIGAIVALEPPAGVDSTVVSSIFGGSGAVSALGAVYAMAKQGIREATLDQARLRMVLTAFATQLGQLRALAETTGEQRSAKLGEAEQINKAIAESMKDALDKLPSIAAAQAEKVSAQAGTSKSNDKGTAEQ